MADKIYSQISKLSGKDVRLVRAAAHHPFSFFSNVMANTHDHRPVRFRYLGAFAVKPNWRKGLKKIDIAGIPSEGAEIYARVPEQKYNKTYINLKKGTIIEGNFESNDGLVVCPISEIRFWSSVIDSE
jgi:hypothetical protein